MTKCHRCKTDKDSENVKVSINGDTRLCNVQVVDDKVVITIPYGFPDSALEHYLRIAMEIGV